MKKFIFLAVFTLFSLSAFAQDQETYRTEKVWRVNFLNPGVEIELPTGGYSTFSTGLGVGYGGGYPDLTYGGNGFIYIIAPFLDMQQKWFYNINKRLRKNKTVDNNSGNFVSARLLTRGHSIAENVYRTSNFDFAVSATWGLQRKYGERFHFLFDIGPEYYFDTNGNGNIFPLTFQVNLGIDL